MGRRTLNGAGAESGDNMPGPGDGMTGAGGVNSGSAPPAEDIKTPAVTIRMATTSGMTVLNMWCLFLRTL